MRRQSIDGGSWFDLDASTRILEGSRHDGHNFISLATGSQWEHETLHVTRKGRFILHHVSDYQGSRESWEELGPALAAQWLVRNERDNDELPPAAAKLLEPEYEATEV